VRGEKKFLLHRRPSGKAAPNKRNYPRTYLRQKKKNGNKRATLEGFATKIGRRGTREKKNDRTNQAALHKRPSPTPRERGSRQM